MNPGELTKDNTVGENSGEKGEGDWNGEREAVEDGPVFREGE